MRRDKLYRMSCIGAQLGLGNLILADDLFVHFFLPVEEVFEHVSGLFVDLVITRELELFEQLDTVCKLEAVNVLFIRYKQSLEDL